MNTIATHMHCSQRAPIASTGWESRSLIRWFRTAASNSEQVLSEVDI